jgi:hypothetical protein
MQPTCDRVRALLPYYADGEVGEAEAAILREHIAECAECRREADRWTALNRIVDRGLRVEEPVPAGEVEEAVRRVREAKPVWQVAPTPVRFWRSWAPMAGLAVLAIAIALVGVNRPPLELADARAMVRDETAALVRAPAQLAAGVPRDYEALRRSARLWPQQTVASLAEQWERGAALSQAVTRRVGPAPLAACALLLLAANFAFAREVRGSHGRLQGG